MADVMRRRHAHIPLGSPAAWHQLRFRDIPPHIVEFDEAGLRLQVCRSAMPLVHRLEQPTPVARVRASGVIRGMLDVEPADQGRGGFDDYTLRIGLVEAGETRLGRWGRLRFLNLGVDPAQIGARRTHPVSRPIEEHVVAVPGEDGRFIIDVPLVPPPVSLGVWLSADGDDTQSCFSVVLDRLELEASVARPG